ncbi:MAG TPA: chemotaxis protein CheW, partial [Thalassospira lucentensis]|nr:chemotaxis protein CheW [Thalassospira lucentensis]
MSDNKALVPSHERGAALDLRGDTKD